MRQLFGLLVVLSFFCFLPNPVLAEVTVEFSVDVSLALGAPTGEDEIARMVNEGLSNMGRTNPAALALYNSGQTIKIICYGSDKAKELKIEKPEMSFIPVWGETVGAFNADGTPTRGGTTYIVIDCDRLRTGRWYTNFTFLGVTQSMWDILVHELLHATDQARRHPPDTLDRYQNWVTAFNQSIATLLQETKTTDEERGYLRLSEEWMEQFKAALIEELRKNQQGPGSGSSSQQGSTTTTPENTQNQQSGQKVGMGSNYSIQGDIRYASDQKFSANDSSFSFVSGVTLAPYETPEFFLGFDGLVPFSGNDMMPQPMAPVRDNTIKFEIGARYALDKQFSIGLTYDWAMRGQGNIEDVDNAYIEDYLSRWKYKFAVGGRFDSTIVDIPWISFIGRQEVTVNPVINNNESKIVYFNSNANTWLYGERFTEESGIMVNWNTLNYGSHVQGDLQVAPKIRTDLLRFDPGKISGIGPNAGINIAPAPGLDPKEWPQARGEAIPSLKIEVGR